MDHQQRSAEDSEEVMLQQQQQQQPRQQQQEQREGVAQGHLKLSKERQVEEASAPPEMPVNNTTPGTTTSESSSRHQQEQQPKQLGPSPFDDQSPRMAIHVDTTSRNTCSVPGLVNGGHVDDDDDRGNNNIAVGAVGSFDVVEDEERRIRQQQQLQQQPQQHEALNHQQQVETIYQEDEQFKDDDDDEHSSSLEDDPDQFDDNGISFKHRHHSYDEFDYDDEEHVPLIELGEETMAQAMLIFLLADLRILSATGRIRTKFEHLCLDSDHSPRISSLDYAGFYDYISESSSDDDESSLGDVDDELNLDVEDEQHYRSSDEHDARIRQKERKPKVKKKKTHGITASHIMAVLLVEILKEAEDVNKHSRYYEPQLLSPWDVGDKDKANRNHGYGYQNQPRNAKKVFQRDIRAANGLPSLLHCYNEMLSEDVSRNISRVSRTLYPLDEDMEQEAIFQTKIQKMTDHNTNFSTAGEVVGTPSLPPQQPTSFPPPLNSLQFHHRAESTGGVSMHSGSVSFAVPDTPGSSTPQDFYYQSDRMSEDDSLWSRELNERAGTKQPNLAPPPAQQPPSMTSITTSQPTAKPSSVKSLAVSPSAVPPMPPPKAVKPRSSSMSFANTFETRSDIVTVMSRHSSQSKLNYAHSQTAASVGGNFPNHSTHQHHIHTSHRHRTARRRSVATSNFQVSHFNPNVDIRELMEDDENGDYKLHNRQLKQKERRQQTKEKLREMLQETIQQYAPTLDHDKIAQRILPPSPTHELTKIAEVQNQLLNWTIAVPAGTDGVGNTEEEETEENGVEMDDSARKPAPISAASSLSSGSPDKMPMKEQSGQAVVPEIHQQPSSLSEDIQQQPSSLSDGCVVGVKTTVNVNAARTTWTGDTVIGASDTAVGTNTTDNSTAIMQREVHEKEQQVKQTQEQNAHNQKVQSLRKKSLIGQREHHNSDQQQFHDSNTIRRLILQALDKRDFWRLGFIKNFFREGTVSHILANSSAEMVWLSDWHTQHECTYAISIDRAKNKVLLAFRGAYTESDWKHIVDWYDTATSNPVKDNYPNRATNIRLHSGFHKYLFRVRKDTNTTKYDEIAAKLSHYCNMTRSDQDDGDGKKRKPLRITITGHSLGAALATIFSLYASTEDRFTGRGNSLGTTRCIECVTFGSPFIGNWRFAGAVKHQENVGKLRIAKFHVKGDSVPHLPPALIRTSSHGAQYWHSGIDISLPYIRNKFFRTITFGYQPKPKLTYHDPDSESYLGSLARQFREYYVWNLPLRFWRFALFHTLVEHKKRMALVSKEDPNSLLTTCSLKQLYEMRSELTDKARSTRRRINFSNIRYTSSKDSKDDKDQTDIKNNNNNN